MPHVEQTRRAIEFKTRRVVLAGQIFADENKPLGRSIQIKDEDRATILMTDEHQPAHTAGTAIRVAQLVDETCRRER